MLAFQPEAVLLTWLMFSAALGADLGDPVDEALLVHLPPAGFDALAEAVERRLPTAFSLEGGETGVSCSGDTGDVLAASFPDFSLYLSADTVALVPTEDQLTLVIDLTLSSDAIAVAVAGSCSILEDLDEECGLELPTTALSVTMPVDLVPTGTGLDATVGAPELSVSPVGNPLSDCTAADAIGTLLGQDPEALANLIVDLVEPALADLPETVEPSLDDALGDLAISTALSLGAGELLVDLAPSRVEVTEAGLYLGLSASFDVDTPDDCVPWDAGLEVLDTGWPAADGTADGTSLAYDAGLFLGRDMLDHALFAAWSSGLFCIEISDLSGAALTAGLFEAALGERFLEIVDEDTPVTLAISPESPPLIRFEEDGAPLHIDVSGLFLEVQAPVDDRDVVVAIAELTLDLPLDIDVSTEAVVTGLALDPKTSLFVADHETEFLDAGYGAGLQDLVSGVIDSVLPSDLFPEVALPSLLGVEIDGVYWAPTENGAFHGGYVLLDASGVEPVELGGCSVDALGCNGESAGSVELDFNEVLGCEDAGGCEDSGCGVPGVVSVPLGRLVPLSLVLMGVARRRRNE